MAALRRSITVCALALAGLSRGSPVQTLTIVTSPRVDAFDRAVQALRTASAAAGVNSQVVEANAAAPGFCGLVLAGSPSMIVSVGTEAARASGSCDGNLVRVAALTVGPGPTRRIAPLDVPPAEVMRAVRRWFPRRTRLGVIINPATALYTVAEIETAAQEAGLRVTIGECSGAERLLSEFDRLTQDSELVWCLPDIHIYTAATLKQLVLVSLARKIPLIGFSENFLLSGAALAVFPDFDRVAAHTAECVRLLLAGKPVPSTPPDYFSTGLNRRVLRLMNVPFREQARSESVILID